LTLSRFSFLLLLKLLLLLLLLLLPIIYLLYIFKISLNPKYNINSLEFKLPSLENSATIFKNNLFIRELLPLELFNNNNNNNIKIKYIKISYINYNYSINYS